MPSNIKAMPTAMSFTRGRPQSQPWSKPNTAPIAEAATTPSHAEPVRYDIP
jgi:hypothetical protein